MVALWHNIFYQQRQFLEWSAWMIGSAMQAPFTVSMQQILFLEIPPPVLIAQLVQQRLGIVPSVLLLCFL